MNYPAYVVPNTAGITWASGPGTLQALPAGYLCSEADAQIILAAFHAAGVQATLENAVNLPGFKFSNLAPSNPAQPWWVIGPDGTLIGPAGFAVGIMYTNGVGAPGEWTGIGTGNVKWVPAGTVAPMPPPPATTNPADAATWASIEGAGQGYQQSDRDVLNDTRRLVVALAKIQGLS